MEPTATSARVRLVDGLRGFTLFGVAVVNAPVFALAYAASQPAKLGAEWWLRTSVMYLLTDKFWTLLTFLFGVGFARIVERGGARLHARRMAGLLLIGLVHLVFLSSVDVLALYAVVGLLLLAVRGWSTRVLLLVAAAMVLAGAVLIALVPYDPAGAGPRAFGRLEHAALAGSYLDLVRANYGPRLSMFYTADGAPYLLLVLSRFLAGYAAGRSRLLDDAERAAPFARRLLAAAAPTAAVLIGVQLYLEHAAHHLPAKVVALTSGLAWEVSTVALAAVYLAGWVLLWRRPSVRRALETLAPLGRMTLTFYLAQSLIFVPLCYHFGLGLAPLGYGQAAALGAGVFALEVVAARAWARRFAVGPFEWLWRSLTYGHRVAAK